MLANPSTPLSVRAAVAADIPFLARIEEFASTPPFAESMWTKIVVPTGVPLRRFFEAMFRTGASRWGGVEDFLVLERQGVPVAACAVYEPEADAADRRSLRLERLPDLAAEVGMDEGRTSAFRAAYEEAWGPSGPWLAPQAPAIIETVGVLPEARGGGVGRQLMDAAFERARRLGHGAIGVSYILGNDGGRRLYESVGFEPVMTFHAAFFDDAFPGFVKLRRKL